MTSLYSLALTHPPAHAKGGKGSGQAAYAMKIMADMHSIYVIVCYHDIIENCLDLHMTYSIKNCVLGATSYDIHTHALRKIADCAEQLRVLSLLRPFLFRRVWLVRLIIAKDGTGRMYIHIVPSYSTP